MRLCVASPPGRIVILRASTLRAKLAVGSRDPEQVSRSEQILRQYGIKTPANDGPAEAGHYVLRGGDLRARVRLGHAHADGEPNAPVEQFASIIVVHLANDAAVAADVLAAAMDRVATRWPLA